MKKIIFASLSITLSLIVLFVFLSCQFLHNPVESTEVIFTKADSDKSGIKLYWEDSTEVIFNKPYDFLLGETVNLTYSFDTDNRYRIDRISLEDNAHYTVPGLRQEGNKLSFEKIIYGMYLNIHTIEYTNRDPLPSPDGMVLAFARNDISNNMTYIVSLDGTAVETKLGLYGQPISWITKDKLLTYNSYSWFLIDLSNPSSKIVTEIETAGGYQYSNSDGKFFADYDLRYLNTTTNYLSSLPIYDFRVLALSPGNTLVAGISKSDSSMDVFIWDTLTNKVQRLASWKQEDTFSWIALDPNEQRIFYIRIEGNEWKLCKIDISTGLETILKTGIIATTGNIQRVFIQNEMIYIETKLNNNSNLFAVSVNSTSYDSSLSIFTISNAYYIFPVPGKANSFTYLKSPYTPELNRLYYDIVQNTSGTETVLSPKDAVLLSTY